MFRRVLIANRGPIACRIIRTLRQMGIESVAVYSEADRHAPHVQQADCAVCIGPAPAAQSYLHQENIIAAAQSTKAEAIHPGYGFLSERPDFADAVEAAGLQFMGPTGDQMRAFGLKHEARRLAQEAGVPLVPGTDLIDDVAEALRAADTIGYPVMLKSSAGGGGIGMRVCQSETELEQAFHRVKQLAHNNFGDTSVFLERAIIQARHIEVQVVGDGQGQILTIGDRDCSVQRRNQKVIEEAPAPDLTDQQRADLHNCARNLLSSVNYRSAGTVEFIYDASRNDFFFLEVNSRLQVEHGVTEAISGLDLVELMVRIAAGETSCLPAECPTLQGHAIQARVYAEDPSHDFRPAAGLITQFAPPSLSPSLSGVGADKEIRCDHALCSGYDVPPFYDPLLAKVIAHGDSREEARLQLIDALANMKLDGIEANHRWLQYVLSQETFKACQQTTRWLSHMATEAPYQALALEVLSPGTLTTIQDCPGREGYWHIGVPPSGPMDDLAFRIGNRLLGNNADAAGLEMTMNGPTLVAHHATAICLTGAEMEASFIPADKTGHGDTSQSQALPWYQVIHLEPGDTIQLGGVKDCGCRAYLLVAGGFDVPDYLGSRSTFDLGQFGGHGGRAVQSGDMLRLFNNTARSVQPSQQAGAQSPALDTLAPSLALALRPRHTHHWEIAVLAGPHEAPDFFTDEDIAAFYEADWEVHYNSSRTGVRLIGPKPTWARSDGGEAGLHPSNIHDNAYAIGTIDFTGDMPVVLGRDGPSLGGFVCPATIAAAEFWKIGQAKAGDTIRFYRVDQGTALDLWSQREQMINDLISSNHISPYQPDIPRISSQIDPTTCPAVVCHQPGKQRVDMHIRQAGDRYLLVEYGENLLDFDLRLRTHTLEEALAAQPLPGVCEMVEGIRSLQIRYDPELLSQEDLVKHIIAIQDQLPSIDDISVPSRIVHLPLSWDDPATQEAIDKYQKSVRPDAPWCPSNIEFIRRINGLESIQEVKDIVYNASYLVMGLGDVYLGAPVATPLDPRHRLVTTKYNPARTWTPPNAVGIGGAYLCIYGMEGPGGYQFVGRTCQVWNTYHQTKLFDADAPWLLRPFDQIRWYEVSHQELAAFREDFLQGKADIRIEHSSFNLGEYHEFLNRHQDSIASWKSAQQAAFDAERQRWIEQGLATFVSEEPANIPDQGQEVPEGMIAIETPIPGSVWNLPIQAGDRVSAQQTVAVIEAMKMETAIASPVDGTVHAVYCQEQHPVKSGQTLLVINPQ